MITDIIQQRQELVSTIASRGEGEYTRLKVYRAEFVEEGIVKLRATYNIQRELNRVSGEFEWNTLRRYLDIEKIDELQGIELKAKLNEREIEYLAFTLSPRKRRINKLKKESNSKPTTLKRKLF
jgi:hypothetical protein